MASPSDPTDSSRDQVTEPETLPPNSNPTEKPTVEQGNETLNLKSTQRDLEEPDAIDQQPDPSIGESKNEEDDTDATQAVSSSIYRRGGGGGKKKKGFLKKRKQQEKSREKLEVLLKTLKPIPFVPKKALDFARHEKLLKTLGIWEFLHLEFDQNIRQDLVANLVAYYTTEGRCSYVNGVRVNVTRADLARALKLPKKKDIVITDEEREVLETDESAKFVDEIIKTWVLLHTDDMWVMPVEVVEWGKDVKEKQLEKLDWAALLWFMVEKELKADPPLGDCFFASHLQLLIRNQKEDLLREESKVDDEEEDDVKEVEFMVKSSKEDLLKEESKVGAEDDDDDVKEVEFMVKSPKEDCSEVKEEEKDVVAADSGRDDCATESKEQETYVEEHMIELNLRQETVSEMVAVEQQQQGPVEEQPTNVEEQPMDVEENKKEEDEKWPWNGETHVGTSHFLRHCDLSISRDGDEENNIEGHMEMGEDDEQIEDLEEEDEDTEKHEEGFPFFPNGDSLHGVGQENLILGDASPLRYASGLQMHGNSSDGHFLASMALAASGSNTNNKRQIDHENDMSYHHNPPESKRLRTDEPSWDEKPPPVEVCVEQIMMWAEKARMSCAQKDREGAQSEMNQEYLMSEVQRKDETIHDLKRSMYEEQQRKDLMIYRLETELRMMTSVLEGYRKALKATKKASAEHRKRCPLRDEKPVYKDVKGSGGLVLSVAEVEKLRLKQEEEDRVTRARIERQIEEFGSDCVRVFEEQMDAVELLNERLIEVENEVKICRETLSESKKDETCEVATAAAAAAAEVATAAATEET